MQAATCRASCFHVGTPACLPSFGRSGAWGAQAYSVGKRLAQRSAREWVGQSWWLDTSHDFSFKVGGSRKGPSGQPLPVGPHTVDGAKGVPCDQWTCRQAVSPTYFCVVKEVLGGFLTHLRPHPARVP